MNFMLFCLNYFLRVIWHLILIFWHLVQDERTIVLVASVYPCVFRSFWSILLRCRILMLYILKSRYLEASICRIIPYISKLGLKTSNRCPGTWKLFLYIMFFLFLCKRQPKPSTFCNFRAAKSKLQKKFKTVTTNRFHLFVSIKQKYVWFLSCVKFCFHRLVSTHWVFEKQRKSFLTIILLFLSVFAISFIQWGTKKLCAIKFLLYEQRWCLARII